MIWLRRQSDAVRCPSPAGFTLVELMVVMVVLALLAALTLSGLAGVRDRVKADKTRSTIRKLHEIIVPQYESYLSRRVSLRRSHATVKWNAGLKRFEPTNPPETIVSSTSVPAAPTNRLWGLRVLMTLEMPDQWADVAPTTKVPDWAVTAPVKRYAVLRASSAPSPAYESAECLAMIIMRGGFDADLIEAFRTDEIGDVDGDRHPEFLDGWGKPIGFIRWPVGFASPLLPKNVVADPDPFDPMRVTASIPYPPTSPPQPPPQPQTDYRVLPLIFSTGGDAALDTVMTGSTPKYGGYFGTADVMMTTTGSSSWLAELTNGTSVPYPVPSNRSVLVSGTAPGQVWDDPAANNVRDNITNYDLLKQ